MIGEIAYVPKEHIGTIRRMYKEGWVPNNSLALTDVYGTQTMFQCLKRKVVK